jgi:hypothetical protein
MQLKKCFNNFVGLFNTSKDVKTELIEDPDQFITKQYLENLNFVAENLSSSDFAINRKGKLKYQERVAESRQMNYSEKENTNFEDFRSFQFAIENNFWLSEEILKNFKKLNNQQIQDSFESAKSSSFENFHLPSLIENLLYALKSFERLNEFNGNLIFRNGDLVDENLVKEIFFQIYSCISVSIEFFNENSIFTSRLLSCHSTAMRFFKTSFAVLNQCGLVERENLINGSLNNSNIQTEIGSKANQLVSVTEPKECLEYVNRVMKKIFIEISNRSKCFEGPRELFYNYYRFDGIVKSINLITESIVELNKFNMFSNSYKTEDITQEALTALNSFAFAIKTCADHLYLCTIEDNQLILLMDDLKSKDQKAVCENQNQKIKQNTLKRKPKARINPNYNN